MRKPRDTSRKRESILEAAVTAFIDHGFDGTTMDMIAERANSSKRTVYNHFSSKDVLIEEAFNQFLKDAFDAKKIQYRSDCSIEEQLGEFADSKMMLTEDPRILGLMRVTLNAFITHPHIAERAIEYADSLDDGLVAWLRAANQDGRLKIKDAELAAEVFWSLFSGTFFWPPILEGPVERGRGKRLKKEFIKVFMAQYMT